MANTKPARKIMLARVRAALAASYRARALLRRVRLTANAESRALNPLLRLAPRPGLFFVPSAAILLAGVRAGLGVGNRSQARRLPQGARPLASSPSLVSLRGLLAQPGRARSARGLLVFPSGSPSSAAKAALTPALGSSRAPKNDGTNV